MGPIERAARARAKHDYPDASEADIDEMWECRVPQVRAVIQALREPSEAMLNADGGQDERWDGIFVRNAWRAMIDAALDEGSPEP